MLSTLAAHTESCGRRLGWAGLAFPSIPSSDILSAASWAVWFLHGFKSLQ